MIHSFDTEDAKKYGVIEAIVLSNFRFWISHNKANKRHFYDGRFWTFNSVSAFEELFPYLTYNQIRRVIENLCNAGVLITGNYNNSSYDRTKWYAFFDEMDLANFTNGNVDSAKTVNTDNKPDEKQIKQKAQAPAFDFLKALIDLGIEEKNATTWIEVRKNKKANTELAIQALVRESQKAGMEINDVVRLCAENGWQGFRAEYAASKSVQKKSSHTNFSAIDYTQGVNEDGSF